MIAFSIVIPIYNVVPYLRECLDSVLAQTFTDWEAICVDDGSTDGSGSILDEYAVCDRRFRVIHQTNAGVSVARNVGMLNAVGGYITFLDGDDVYDKNWLTEAANIIAKTGADVVRMRFVKFHDKLPTGTLSSGCKIYDGVEEVRKWGIREFAEGGYSCLVFMKRDKLSMAAGYEFPDEVDFMEDNVFMLRNLPSFSKAVQSEFAGYYYRVRSNSASRGLLTVESVDRLMKEFAGLYDRFGSDIASGIANMLQTVAFSWRERGERKRRGADRSVAIMFQRMFDGGCFDTNRIPFRWRLGFEAIIRFHSFCLMDVLYGLHRLWGRVRMGKQLPSWA